MSYVAKRGKDRKVPVALERWEDDLVRMVWMGLDGRRVDFGRYLERVLPQWKEVAPDLSQRLQELLKSNSAGMDSEITRRMATVREAAPAVYDNGERADMNGAGDLVRLEMSVELPVDPVWPSAIATELQGLVNEHHSAGKLAEAGLLPTHTAIFTGPPGVGKTLAARWLAREMKLPLATLNLGTVMSSFLGRTGANLRQVLHYGQQRPCILLLDEIDAVAKRRDDQSDIGELKRLVTVLLQELDAWPGGSLLIATTNHEQLIDPAVWRRFERRVTFSLPDAKGQSLLLERLLGNDWFGIKKKFREALALTARHISQAELTLIAQRARRDAILGSDRLESCFEKHMGAVIASMPLPDRKRIGVELSKTGISQRAVNRLTGLARETIREIPASDGSLPSHHA